MRGSFRFDDVLSLSGEATLDQTAVRDIYRVTWAGVIGNIILILAKAGGGWWSGSGTLLADAIHSLSDLATDAIVLVGVRYWAAPADEHHQYGHRKIETMATLTIGLFLALVGLVLGWRAVLSLSLVAKGDVANPLAATLATWVALIVSLASIITKEILYRWTMSRGLTLGSPALLANAWHHRFDALSSIPPVITIGVGVVGASLGHNFWYLDPVGTVVVAVMLLAAAWEISCSTLATLLDASADHKLCAVIHAAVAETSGVLAVHKLRTRFLGSGAVEVNLHILVDGQITVTAGHLIAAQVKYRLLSLTIPEVGVRVVDVLVHVEPRS